MKFHLSFKEKYEFIPVLELDERLVIKFDQSHSVSCKIMDVEVFVNVQPYKIKEKEKKWKIKSQVTNVLLKRIMVSDISDNIFILIVTV